MPLFQDEVVAVMAPDHPLASKPFVTAADLATAHLVLYTTQRGQSWLIRDILDPAGVTARGMTQVRLTEGIVELAKAGAGVGALAHWAVAPHLGKGLAAVRITRRGYRRSWSAAMIRENAPPAYLQDFARLLAGGPFATGGRTGSRSRPEGRARPGKAS
jgi:LysR family transcriptional regulator for metE and metH